MKHGNQAFRRRTEIRNVVRDSQRHILCYSWYLQRFIYFYRTNCPLSIALLFSHYLFAQLQTIARTDNTFLQYRRYLVVHKKYTRHLSIGSHKQNTSVKSHLHLFFCRFILVINIFDSLIMFGLMSTTSVLSNMLQAGFQYFTDMYSLTGKPNVMSDTKGKDQTH